MITVGRNTGKQPFYNMGQYICDYETDVANLPINKSAGSIAQVVETGNIYMLNSLHQWILQPASSSGGSGSSDIIYDGGSVDNSSSNNVIYDGGSMDNSSSENENNTEYDGGNVDSGNNTEYDGGSLESSSGDNSEHDGGEV